MPALVPLAVDVTAALSLFLYVMLGVLVGLAAAVFVQGLYFTEDLFEKTPGNYLRHAFGMLIVGIIIYAVKEVAGEYYIGGVDYATDQASLFEHVSDAKLLFALYICELLATAITLGSGSSGGIFPPSLYLGATLGGGFAMMLAGLHLPIPINIPSFAVVGMAAMVGGAT
jgi:chloride channel protein, CIC family